MEYETWSVIPEQILCEIVSYLPVNDRLSARRVCRWWNECFQSPSLWTKFEFKFDSNAADETKAICQIDEYCSLLRDVEMYLNPSQVVSREKAIHTLNEIASSPSKRLKNFAFHFTGINPPALDGTGILRALKSLFSQSLEREFVLRLRVLDLRHCNVPFDDEFLSVLAANHPHLQSLWLRNQCEFDNVSPVGVLQLVSSCFRLETLELFYHSIDDSVVAGIGATEDCVLKRLCLVCNHRDKHGKAVSAGAWATLATRGCPLQVTLLVEDTASISSVERILCENIPLVQLDLNVMYAPGGNLMFNIADQYASSLQVFRLNSGVFEGKTLQSVEFEDGLKHLTNVCGQLRELICAFPVRGSVAELIAGTHGNLRYDLRVVASDRIETISNMT